MTWHSPTREAQVEVNSRRMASRVSPLEPSSKQAATDQAEATGTQKPAGIDTESEPGSDDDMASVIGADLERQEDESIPNHKRRVARMLKERARRRKEEKQREGRADKKKNEGKDGKERVSQKQEVITTVPR